MAFGRMRTTKRSSSSSYASTVTTVVFIALCVLGVWMLTSDSIVSPNSFTRSSTNVRDDKTDENSQSTTIKRTYEDNPGDLPDDAVTTDESRNSRGDQGSDQGNSKDYSKEGNLVDSNQQTDNEGKQKENESRDDDSNVRGKDSETQVNENAGLGGRESVQEQERLNEHHVQVSEESTLTQNQNMQESDVRRKGPENDQEADKPHQPDQVDEGKDGDVNQGNANIRSGEEVKLKDDNQQQTTEEQPKDDNPRQSSEEQPKDDNQQQTTEEQPKDDNQQQTTEEQPKDNNQQQNAEDQQHEQQQKTDKPVTFSDETKKDPTKQEKTEDGTAKPEKDVTNQQDKPEEAGRKVDAQQETDISKPDTAASTGDKSNESSSLLNSGIPKESNESKNSWATQAAQSQNEKQRRQDRVEGQDEEKLYGYSWKLCNVTAGPDYIPCLDNEKAIKRLHSTKHFEHRERHCPEDPSTCLVPVPEGYKRPVQWPQSRDKIWFHNVPHPELAKVKGHQNWVKVSGEFLTFPGGGTQFIHGALHYIEFIEKLVPGIKWGKHTRVVLDVGCGVASFGGFLFDKDVLTMSFAPKDEHEAQVQFALERGIPAISAVMGSKRLPFPSGVFDIVHCARCRVPWHIEDGRLLLELNRVLRPGGFFVWSATPVYQKLREDVEIWEAMSALTASMCWKLEKKEKDKLNKIGAAIFRKPNNNVCYDRRPDDKPPMCQSDDDPNATWDVPLKACMHRVPTDEVVRGSKWPPPWPRRLRLPPYWLNKSQMGIYGKSAPDDFVVDFEHWQNVVNNSYLNGLGISWSNVRNVMDMRAVYGGFAAALRNLEIWVLNVVNVNSPDTLPIIYERGLFGIYHDWCESFSTYPRTYDLLHADHLFSKLRERCKLAPVMAEVDRIVRPGGKLIVRDDSSAIGEVENLLKSLHWEVHLTFSKDQEGILSATKSDWRPTPYSA